MAPRYGRNIRDEGWGTITINTSQNPVLRIQSETFSRFFPDFTALWSPYNQTLRVDALDLPDLDESHYFAWDLLFGHIYEFEKQRSSTSLVDTLENWQSQLGPWAEQHLTDPQSVPHIIAALGNLLSPECLGCNSSLFGQILMFLSRTLPSSMTYDPYVAAATLSALCEITRDEPAWLQRTVMAIKAVPAAEDFVNWVATDPSCQYYFPISDDLYSTLQLIFPNVSQRAILPPQIPYQRPFRSRQQQRLALGPPPQLYPPMLGPSAPVMQRPLMPVRSKTSPSVRGSYLPPNVLMKVAWRHPDQVKVDGRVFFDNARSYGYPAYPGMAPRMIGGI